MQWTHWSDWIWPTIAMLDPSRTGIHSAQAAFWSSQAYKPPNVTLVDHYGSLWCHENYRSLAQQWGSNGLTVPSNGCRWIWSHTKRSQRLFAGKTSKSNWLTPSSDPRCTTATSFQKIKEGSYGSHAEDKSNPGRRGPFRAGPFAHRKQSAFQSSFPNRFPSRFLNRLSNGFLSRFTPRFRFDSPIDSRCRTTFS